MQRYLIFILLIGILSNSCTEGDSLFTVSTEEYSVSGTITTLKGHIETSGAQIIEHGHCWSITETEPNLENSSFTAHGALVTSGDYSSAVTGLKATTYYYRAYGSSTTETIYGEVKTLNLKYEFPTVYIDSVYQISPSGALVAGQLIITKGEAENFGICWSHNADPTTQDNNIAMGRSATSQSFVIPISNLDAQTNYNIRGFIIYNKKLDYDRNVTFKTLASENIWVEKASNSLRPRVGAIAFSVNDYGYYGTGDDGQGSKNDIWRFDPRLNGWTQMANFKGSRNGAFAFVVDKRVFAGGGESGLDMYSDFYEYDYAKNIWASRAVFYNQNAVKNAASFSLKGKGYVVCGQFGSALSSVYSYDPEINSWSKKKNFVGGARAFAVGYSTSEHGFVGLGESETELFDDFWRYDPATDEWSKLNAFKGGKRSKASILVLSTEAYVGLGTDGVESKTDWYRYNPGTDSWTTLSSLPSVARHSAVAFSVGAYGYIIGGKTYLEKTDIWQYKR
ncbi:MAG TPA: hypothetical protein DCQ31_13655 [Bacteroidales bacterium]|nr:hypothetical protein [Bacteroidales bacterium]